jgi:hypothetical protein
MVMLRDIKAAAKASAAGKGQVSMVNVICSSVTMSSAVLLTQQLEAAISMKQWVEKKNTGGSIHMAVSAVVDLQPCMAYAALHAGDTCPPLPLKVQLQLSMYQQSDA